MVRRVSLLLALVLAAAMVPATAYAQAPRGMQSQQRHFTAGASGAGDPYYPLDGNGGYDVQHYDLQLKYTPDTDVLIGRTTIIALATQDLSSFDLDLTGLTVQTIRVNGLKAKWTRDGQELVITPRLGLRKGWPFIVTVSYTGIPQVIEDENDTGPGWIATDDGALVVGEPHGATTWFPVNDHPSDKATYTMHIAVPNGTEAISNGRLVSKRTAGIWTTWNWRMDQPMASYLATATIGQFELSSYQANGIDYLDAVDPDLFGDDIQPATGAQYVYSQAVSNSYKRLARTVTVPAEGATLSFSVNRQTEPNWDFFFVEAHTVGADDWTTLPDINGHTSDFAGNACPFWFGIHPFLAHYESDDGQGSCTSTGTTGSWSAASGTGEGYEEWSVDLSAYAGTDVELSLSYASDESVQGQGVFIDDIDVSTGEGSTSFEDDGDTLDGWTIPGAPAGSPGNTNDWFATATVDLQSLGDNATASLATVPLFHDFEAGLFGPYPFSEGGGIVDDVQGLGFALENQTRPIYALDFFTAPGSGDSTVVHENAHQWFGDSVSVANWKDIWLNEGFATYAEWLADEEFNGVQTQDSFNFYYDNWPADSPFWALPIGDPGAAAVFAGPVYYRGAMTLQVLRNTIGDDAFFLLLRTWTSQHAYGNASIPEFIELAEKVSGQDLTELFQTWLYTPSRPELDVPEARMAGLPTPWPAKTLDPAAPRK